MIVCTGSAFSELTRISLPNKRSGRPLLSHHVRLSEMVKQVCGEAIN